MVRWLGVAVVAAGALALGGCAQKLDTGKIESEVKKELAGKTGSQIASVDCPGDVEPKKGDTFRCTARTVGGEQVPIEVIQEDAKGTVRWHVVQDSTARPGL
jgi:hypothetical protein